MATQAQTIVLKTGQRVDTTGVRRSGDKVMGKIAVAGTVGEAGHDVSAIAKIEFPEPQGIKRAAEFLSQGEPRKRSPISTRSSPSTSRFAISQARGGRRLR
jgi:hypothetical protein